MEPEPPNRYKEKDSGAPTAIEIKQWNAFLETVPLVPTPEEKEFILEHDEDERGDPAPEEIDQQNRFLLRQQRHFRVAAVCVADAFAAFTWVEKVAVIGSVALPLKQEVPRFYRYRRAHVKLWHECRDVDLAVWVRTLGDLNLLRKAKSRALNDLHAATNSAIGTAHHQVDVHMIEDGTDRYLGRLCDFSVCPKGKPECLVKDCGVHPFLQ